MNLKTLFSILILIFVAFSTSGCLQKVPAGHVGVKVYLLGTNKGVDHEVLGVGRYWIGINEELYIFPTYTVNYVWTKDPAEGSPNDESITFQTKEGLDVNADVGISYHVIPDKVDVVFQKYRKGIEEITDVYLRNMVRDAFVQAASKKPVTYIYGEGKSELIKEVQSIVSKQVEPIGIKIERIYLIGKLRLPPQIVDAINAKIQATQKAQQRENEIKEAEAEAQKKRVKAKGEADAKLLKAQAEAKANEIVAKSLTPELIEYYKAMKWDGKLPNVLASDKSLLMINP